MQTSLKTIQNFHENVPKILNKINEFIKELYNGGKHIAVYGASHIPINIINCSGIGQYLEYALDKQTKKVGKFLPGSKLEIKKPSFLNSDCPDYCLIAAIGNETKIIEQHGKYLSKGGKFICLFPLRIISS